MTTRERARELITEALLSVAPEVDMSEVADDIELREELDIDSMDFLNFIIALAERARVDIPELDYPKLATLADGVDYLVERMP